MHRASSCQSADAIRQQSDQQIVSGYLAMIEHLPREKRLDALLDILATPLESQIRAPLLREFNNLSERTKA